MPCGPRPDASRRISKDRPSVVRCRRVHSRCDISAAASEQAEPPLIHVPSPRFSTALMAYSSPTLHVCCNVLPTMGFLVFRQFSGCLPTRRSCPPKFSPRAWRSPLAMLEWTDASSPPCLQSVHRAPCLLTLHRNCQPRREGRRRRGSLKAFLQARARAMRLRFQMRQSILPWACCPLLLLPKQSFKGTENVDRRVGYPLRALSVLDHRSFPDDP